MAPALSCPQRSTDGESNPPNFSPRPARPALPRGGAQQRCRGRCAGPQRPGAPTRPQRRCAAASSVVAASGRVGACRLRCAPAALCRCACGDPCAGGVPVGAQPFRMQKWAVAGRFPSNHGKSVCRQESLAGTTPAPAAARCHRAPLRCSRRLVTASLAALASQRAAARITRCRRAGECVSACVTPTPPAVAAASAAGVPERGSGPLRWPPPVRALLGAGDRLGCHCPQCPPGAL